MRLGDIVEIRPHIDLEIGKTLFTKPCIGIIKSNLSMGFGLKYYDVLLYNGRVISISEKQLELVNEDR